MSLNRSEQALYDYIRGHAEERQYLQHKVRVISSESDDVGKAVARIDMELWRYYEERGAAEPSFREDLRVHGPKRISMKNLAEYLVRMWIEPRPRKPPPGVGTLPRE
jgi:hypothetical protein